MKDIFNKVKEDLQKILKVEFNSKRRLHLLKFCLNSRFTHLFRNIEPEVTRKIADELDNWFFKQVCEVICPHWDVKDKDLFLHFFAPICYGGSGMTLFKNKVDVAYAASFFDCLFDKGIAFNGNIPIGSK